MDKGFDSRLDQGWWALRIGLGVGPFLAGLDKYFNVLTNWTGYISPLALKILPFSGQTFMHIIGVVEMIVGLAILTKWTRVGAYIASVRAAETVQDCGFGVLEVWQAQDGFCGGAFSS